MQQLSSDADIRRALENARTIAVLGAHDDSSRPAFYVPDYLYTQGYRIVPVNVMLAGKVLWGETVRKSLLDLTEPVDIVDVFRRSEALAGHLPEFLGMSPLPKVVWFQLGIQHDEVAGQLLSAGISVVQNRCTLADHRRMGLGPRAT